ncbi:hypothetical protein J3R83DRAFT_13176 [Lanmaoa asiatica]|nr:hypothetical protein J3R83DRAFT_13176 [Lanmaoa asiatica]
MDPAPCPPSNFALLGFVELMELVMEEQGIDVLVLHWTQEGARGIQPQLGNNQNNADQNANWLSPNPLQHPLPPPPAPPAVPADQQPPTEDQPIIFDPDITVSTILTSHPANYAIRCIKTCKYVPLWYFTREGL